MDYVYSSPTKARGVGLGKNFVIHSLHHTMLTRLGEPHPTPKAVERAFERLQLSGDPGQIEASAFTADRIHYSWQGGVCKSLKGP